jgi:hypothetical protein
MGQRAESIDQIGRAVFIRASGAMNAVLNTAKPQCEGKHVSRRMVFTCPAVMD